MDNYRAVWARFPFGRYLLNSALMALLVVAGVLLTSTLGGYALARYRFRLREAVFVLFLTSLMIPFQLR
ncbi:MAG TPA: carbohydrate ABC transporter permease, partial [Thermaerobacter sp.]